MRLSRSGIYALIGVLVAGALGTGMATGASQKKIKTKVTISFQGSDYGDSFSGKVKPKANGKLKRKCRKGRKVTVRQVGGSKVGTDKTNKKGKWVVSVGGLADPGQYRAKAKKKKVRFKGRVVVCKKGKSKPITVP
jgi:hypothetical protein